MKKIVIIIVVVIAVLAILCVSSCNSLVSSEETVEQYRADIKSNLQRRYDLIPNLVETVKAYATHEDKIFTEIADARAAMLNTGNVKEMADANATMSSAVSRLLAISEAYPELKANENFIGLQTQLESTENRINVARTKYNEAVQYYNSKIRKFPGVIFAGLMGMEKAEYFQASEAAQDAHIVDFGG